MSNISTTEKAPVIVPAEVAFRAIDTYVESNIVSAKEVKTHGGDRVVWGDGDKYPDYLFSLYREVASLGSIVNGLVDYIAGDAVELLSELFPDGKCNTTGELPVDIVRGAALDWGVVGGFALEVIRGRDGRPAEIYNIDIERLRTDEDNTVFYYNEGWAKGSRKMKVMPAYMPDLDWLKLTDEERDRHAASIVYVKNNRKQTYPMPLYAQAVKACEIERCIDEYHLNSINNGFSASVMINFLNGIPDDEVKAEIEKDLTEKFTGHQNAARMFIGFSPDRMHSVQVEQIKTDDFGARYDALFKRSRQQIFTSFRANPNLFGIPTESLGFSSEEYAAAFDLFNRTQVRPAQQKICDAFDRICGAKGVLHITPFTLTGAVAETVQ